ncbi:MAG: 3-oxoacyl-ACP reductase [Ignavibacteria bacterium GWA2_35_9]|nr:MAG: 3-oxoacyl-ACP reductase [Ignavibacteria bacterium GWA2_35_9]OGU98550.1 MAG: 3-oxoacyl-ACP reductase [Ignavibacteria bacterium RIFOXYB2_FULL_36_7]
MNREENKKYWALILGASSGFGEGVALKLAEDGFNIAGVHLDRQTTIHNVDRIVKQIESSGSQAKFFNINAADDKKRSEVISELKKMSGGQPIIKVLLHSLAFGTLRPFTGLNNEQPITKAQIEMTLDVMAHSIVYWTQELISDNLIAKKARIFAMTSSGGHSVIPHYGAVSAAKAAVESHVRQLAYELGPMDIAVNAIMAGVTDTPALRKIPGNEPMIQVAERKNPRNRLTTPADIAKVISILCMDGGEWISGGIINADGGEDIVNFVGQGKKGII